MTLEKLRRGKRRLAARRRRMRERALRDVKRRKKGEGLKEEISFFPEGETGGENGLRRMGLLFFSFFFLLLRLS